MKLTDWFHVTSLLLLGRARISGWQRLASAFRLLFLPAGTRADVPDVSRH